MNALVNAHVINELILDVTFTDLERCSKTLLLKCRL
jgi:hypothetical protein